MQKNEKAPIPAFRIQQRSKNWFIDFMSFKIFITPMLIKFVFAGFMLIVIFAILATIFPTSTGEAIKKVSSGTGTVGGHADFRTSMRIMTYAIQGIRVLGILMAFMIIRIVAESLIVIFHINSNIEGIKNGKL